MQELLIYTGPIIDRGEGETVYPGDVVYARPSVDPGALDWGVRECLDGFLVVAMDTDIQPAHWEVPNPLAGVAMPASETVINRRCRWWVDIGGIDLDAIYESEWTVPVLGTEALHDKSQEVA